MIVKRTKLEKKRLAVRSRGTREIEVSVRKTNSHFYSVVYSCKTKSILFSVSTLNLKEKTKTSVESASKIGIETAKKLKEMNISEVFFNKLTYKYHGKVASFVDSLRSSGISV
jgi:large subunit ribosomal protein L18